MARQPEAPLRQATRFTIAPPTGSRVMSAGVRTSYAVSADGRKVAFVVEPKYRVHVRSLDQFDGRTLDGTDNAAVPFFSPDGQWVGYTSGNAIRKVPFDGGTSLAVGDATGWVAAPTWTRDDTIVFATQAGGLMRIPASGGRAERLFDSPEGELARQPYAVPGHDVVLYVAQRGVSRAVMVINLKTGERRKLVVVIDLGAELLQRVPQQR